MVSLIFLNRCGVDIRLLFDADFHAGAVLPDSIQISKKAIQIKYFYSIDSSNKSNDAVRGNK